MDIIAADYVGMLSYAEDLIHHVRKLYDEISRIKYVINDIDIFWEGEANNEFHLAMNEDFVIMETLCLKIRISANLLKEAVLDYVQTENEINLMIGGL